MPFMRFLIDITDLHSPLRDKYARVLEKLLTEIAAGRGVPVEIAEGAGSVMAVEPRARKAQDIWGLLPRFKPQFPAYWIRAAQVVPLLVCPKFIGRFLSRRSKDGMAWQFAYSVEIFSPRLRRRIARVLDIESDPKRRALFDYWLGERGFAADACLGGSPKYDARRAISVEDGDVLIFAGVSWRHDIVALEKWRTLSRSRLVCLIYDLLPIDYPSFVTVRQRRRYEKFLCDIGCAADLIVTPNRDTLSRLSSFYVEQDILPARVASICLSGATLSPLSVKPTSRLFDFGLPERKFMLCVSDLRERKHVLWIHALCAKLRCDQPELPLLVVAGRVVHANVLAILSNDPAWGKGSLFIEDPLDVELTWLYENAQLCLQPSFEGGTGMSIMEAIKFGRHCITANAPSLIEAGGGRAEYLPRDEMLWSAAILRALEKNDGPDSIRASWPAVSQDILSQVEELLKTDQGLSTETQTPLLP